MLLCDTYNGFTNGCGISAQCKVVVILDKRRYWLINFRKGQEKTQENVAALAGISRSYYTQIETGERGVSPEVAKRIASVLNFPWTIFFENECA